MAVKTRYDVVEDEDEKEFKTEPDIIENYVTEDEALESIYNAGKI